MIWEHVRQKDWDEFQRRWPEAVNFLIHADLMGELVHLESLYKIKHWAPNHQTMVARLMELRGWYASIQAIVTARPAGMKMCPICGEVVSIHRETTADGRLIASCGDTFPWQKWEEE